MNVDQNKGEIRGGHQKNCVNVLRKWLDRFDNKKQREQISDETIWN